MPDTLDATVARILPEIADLRHELHAHPEIRFEEHWTSDRIARFLNAAGVPHKRGYAGGAGIVATIGGDGPRTVALRADMDAIEVEEETGLPYASQTPGRMHACGHDGHTAMLCGAAKTLATHKDELRGTVRLLFQPAEELGAGGRLMAAEGAVEGVDAVFGLHAWPALPLGRVGLRPGWLMASADTVHIEVRGKGCHGADPAAGVDPVVVAAHIVCALQTIVARELEPGRQAVVTIACIHAGEASNIVPETARLVGTLRAFEPETLVHLRSSIERIAENTAHALRASAAVRFPEDPYPAVYSDPAMTSLLRETACETLGTDAVVDLATPIMVSEDFAYYLERVPGAFCFLGVNPDPAKPHPALHTSRFNFPDEALGPGIRLMAHLAARFLSHA